MSDAGLADLCFPPASPRAPLPAAAGLQARGIRVRPAANGDLPFFQSLYAATRMEEAGVAALPHSVRAAFLDSQFRLQHRHFVGHYPRADFLAVLRASPPFAARPIGRLYVDRARRHWHLIEIALVPDARGQALGSALIAWLAHAAREAGASALTLQVAHDNPRAVALYERLGFVDQPATAPTHRRMICRA